MAFDPPGLALPWLQLLHALSFGASHLGAMMLIARIVPAGQGATAQGYLAIAMGAAMAAATGLSGLLFGAFGSAGLCGDGASVGRRRRLRGCSAPGAACSASLISTRRGRGPAAPPGRGGSACCNWRRCR